MPPVISLNLNRKIESELEKSNKLYSSVVLCDPCCMCLEGSQTWNRKIAFGDSELQVIPCEYRDRAPGILSQMAVSYTCTICKNNMYAS